MLTCTPRLIERFFHDGGTTSIYMWRIAKSNLNPKISYVYCGSNAESRWSGFRKLSNRFIGKGFQSIISESWQGNFPISLFFQETGHLDENFIQKQSIHVFRSSRSFDKEKCFRLWPIVFNDWKILLWSQNIR